MADIEGQPNRLSLWVVILTGLMAIVSLAMAITTLPRSGPYCRSGCVGYPYTDVAAFVPRDYLWMYAAVVLTLLVMALMECIHYQVPPDRQLLSRIGVAFTIMASRFLSWTTRVSSLSSRLPLSSVRLRASPHGLSTTPTGYSSPSRTWGT